MNDHLFGKELFICFTANAFRKLPSINVFSYFPFGLEGRMWDLISRFLIVACLFTSIKITYQHILSVQPVVTGNKDNARSYVNNMAT